jgi:hypothetical protein
VILRAKFTKKAPDSMNFVNFAEKTPCFQKAPPGVGIAFRDVLSARRSSDPARPPKLTLPPPGPISAAHLKGAFP